MASVKPVRRVDRGSLWVIGCSGAIFLLLLSPFIAFEIHDTFFRIWSISVENNTDNPVSIVLTFEGPDRELRFENVSTEWQYGRYFHSEHSPATIRAVRVIQGERQRETEVRRRLDVGSNVRFTVGPDLNVTTSVDLDAHM